ncbi:MAG: kelch motif-containing protein [Thermoplasmata archaeon]|nr:kelch motif-containing protein [Thermoplasmata archaeon]
MVEVQRTRKIGSTVAGISILFAVATLILAGVPPLSPEAKRLPAASVSAGAVGSHALAAARDSLANGGGPAAGVPWSCQGSGGGVDCAASGPSSPSIATVTTLPSWNQLAFTPSARSVAGGTTMAYDAADGYVLLFGGANLTSPLADTWSFSNGLWTHLHPKTSPSARWGAAMTYDTAAGYVLMFGGYDGNVTAYGDTWSFVKGQWTQLKPTTTPSELFYAEAAYDANDSYVVLFGGVIGPAFAALSHATYTFAGGNWHKLTPPLSPPGREVAAMAYDAVDGWVVLFGGLNQTHGVIGDTWNFSAGHWTNRTGALTASPKPRDLAAMAYDAADKSVILFGGRTGASKELGDTWSFAHGSWTRPTPAYAPSARGAEGLSATTSTGGVTLFGGGPASGGLAADTWSYGGGVWNRVLPPQPAPRFAAMAAYDVADGCVVLFGGEGVSEIYGDTWTFSGGNWHHLHPAIAPSARILGMMAYDGADGYVVLYGGADLVTGNYLNDTWTFHGGLWHELPLPSPTRGITLPGAVFGSITFDAADGYLLMFGGLNQSTVGSIDLGTTLEFSDGNWSVAAPTTSPPARDGAAMAYDSWDGEVVLFGGENISANVTYTYHDTWVWSGGSWSDASSKPSPPGRVAAAMVYDETDGYVLLFGGLNETGAYIIFGDAWSFVGGLWTKLAPAVSPGRLWGAAAAFDAKTSTVVLFGGTGSAAAPFIFPQGTWTY